MRKVLLLYNPHSGPRAQRSAAAVEQAAQVLRAAGVEAAITPTLSPTAAAQQVREALAEGSDTIFACGGDGTVQDVAQGLVGTQAALALIPLGTANVLAHDLGIPADPQAAARAALEAVPLRVSVGHIEYRGSAGQPASRYFLSVAGAGQDGYLFHRLTHADKRTFAVAAYLLKALQVWLTRSPQWFSVSVSDEPPVQVTQLLAVRIADFGNVLRNLAPGASLRGDDFRLVLFKTSSRWRYLLFVLRGILGTNWAVPGIEMKNAKKIACAPASPGENPVFFEADGELLGTLPAEISIAPSALTLLVPGSRIKTR